MVATAELPLLQAPPVTASLSIVVLHIEVLPLMGLIALTVTVTEALQPVPVRY
jgi:hypothetical protein